MRKYTTDVRFTVFPSSFLTDIHADSCFHRQYLAVAMDGAKKTRIPRVGLDLLPQPGNRTIDRSRGRHIHKPPDLLEQLVLKDHARMTFGEDAQDFEFPVRQMQIARAPVASRAGNQS